MGSQSLSFLGDWCGSMSLRRLVWTPHRDRHPRPEDDLDPGRHPLHLLETWVVSPMDPYLCSLGERRTSGGRKEEGHGRKLFGLVFGLTLLPTITVGISCRRSPYLPPIPTSHQDLIVCFVKRQTRWCHRVGTNLIILFSDLSTPDLRLEHD